MNYASAFLGAQIVESHEEAKSASSLLNDDKEKYLLVPCKAQRKSFTVQLSRDVVVSGVSLSNSEFFSSGVKNFTLLGGLQYPCKYPCVWKVLGHFQANSTRNHQYFETLRETIRFMKFLWVSSTGNQVSCTLTTFRVFGVDVLDSLSEDFDINDQTYEVEVPRHTIRNFSSQICDVAEREQEEQFALTNFQCPKRRHSSRRSRIAHRDVDDLKEMIATMNASMQLSLSTRCDEDRRLMLRVESCERDKEMLRTSIRDLQHQTDLIKKIVFPGIVLSVFGFVAVLSISCFALRKSSALSYSRNLRYLGECYAPQDKYCHSSSN